MTASDPSDDGCTRPPRSASWTGRFALALLGVVAALAAVLVQPSEPQASHATDGETLAWVEAHDGFDASAGLVDAAVADRPTVLAAAASSRPGAGLGVGLAGDPPPPAAAGACRARLLAGVPSGDPLGCELPKAAGDLPELEPPRPAAAAGPPGRWRTGLLSSDPRPGQAWLQQPLRPPSA